MRRIRWILAATAVLAVAIVTVPLLLPTETVRRHVVAQVEAATGLDIRLEGAVHFSIWPLLDLVAEDVAVRQGSDLALHAERVRFGLAVFPLLSGSAHITELALDSPVLTLASGGDAPPATGEPARRGLPRSADLAAISVERLAISNGALVLLPRSGGEPTIVDAVDVDIAMPAVDRRMRFDVALRYDGHSLAAAGSLETPARLLDSEAADLTLSVDVEDVLGHPVSLAGQVVRTDDRIRVDALDVSVGESRLAGMIEAVLVGDVPYVEARMVGERLDMDAILGGDNGERAADGTARQDGDRDFDFAALSTFAADVELAVGEMILAGMVLQPLEMRASVEGGRLQTAIERIGYAGGSLAGTLLADPASGPLPVINGSLRGQDLDLAALAGILAAPYGVSGRLGADLRFATAGANAAEFVHNANAAGEVSIAGASVSGLGLGGALSDPAADRLDDVDISITLTDIRDPVRLDGAVTWRGERFDLSGSGGLAPLLSGGRGDVNARLSSRRVSAGYQGGVTLDGRADGDVMLDTPSLRGLLGWLGHEIELAEGLERFAFAGKLDGSRDRVSFADARITLDDTTGTGSGSVVLGERPRIEARLALDRLDVTPYAASDGRGGGGNAADGGWSDAAIDLSGLRAFDAQMEISAATLLYDGIEVSDAELAVGVTSGRLEAALRRLGLYGGEGSGTLTVDASGSVPTVEAGFALSNLDARPFLLAAADFRRIDGRGDVELQLAGTGASQRALVSSLDGSARFDFRDGAVRGIDVSRVAQALSEGILSGWQAREEDRTEFYQLAATFRIEDGRARNDDLHLAGPLVSISGAGTADMTSRQLDYRIEPRVQTERGGEQVGFGVPVVIAGDWAAPRIYPDISGILQNPAAAYEQLRALGGGIFRDLPATSDALGDAVRQGTGMDLDAITGDDGRIDRDAVAGEAVRGLERLLERDRDGQDDVDEDADPAERLRGLFQRLTR